jgi:hypothetical protein
MEIFEATEKIGKNVRVLQHVAFYAEFQFGDRVPGKSCRERENGEQIRNWTVEIEMLNLIYGRLISVFC